MKSSVAVCLAVLLALIAGGAWLLDQDDAPRRQPAVGPGPAASASVSERDAPAGSPRSVAERAGIEAPADAAADRSEVATPASEATVAARPEVHITGRVVDRFGRPVPDAVVHVTLIRADHPSTRSRLDEPLESDRAGRFAFTGRGHRDLAIEVEAIHEDRARALQSVRFQAVEPGQRLELEDLVLADGGSVRGLVTDEGGAAIRDAAVRLHPLDERLEEHPRRWQLFPLVPTRPGGAFVLDHVMPGDYRLAAEAPGRQRLYTDPLTVTDGAVVDIGSLALEERCGLSGRVLAAATGEPVSDADIEVLRARGGSRKHTTSDAEGRFFFDHLPDDRCSVQVEADGFLTALRAEVPTAPDTDLEFRLEAGLALRGVVHDQRSGAPVEEFELRLMRQAPPSPLAEPLRRRLRQRVAEFQREQQTHAEGGDDDRRRRAAERLVRETARTLRAHGLEIDTRVAVDELAAALAGHREGLDEPELHQRLEVDSADGHFAFEGLPEGTYSLEVEAPHHVPQTTAPVELRRGARAPELLVELERGLTVAGRIVHGAASRPVAGARVDLLRPRPPRSPDARLGVRRLVRERLGPRWPSTIHYLHAETDAAGRFEIHGAAAGRYLLRARAPGYATTFGPGLQLDADALDCELVLDRPAALAGRVRGLPLDQLAAARVLLVDLEHDRSVAIATDRSYRFEDLEPGHYLVRAVLAVPGETVDPEAWWRGLTRAEAARLEPDVVVAAGETTRFDVPEVHDFSATLELQVQVDGSAAAAHGLEVDVRELAEPGASLRRPWSFERIVDQRGRCELKGLPPGRYRVRISPSDDSDESIEPLDREVLVLAGTRNLPPPFEMATDADSPAGR